MSLAFEQVNNHRSRFGETPFSMDLPQASAELTPPAPQNDDLAAVLSPTQVSTVMDCPYRWWAKYGLGLPDVQTSSLALGKAVHAVLGENFRQKCESKVDLPTTAVMALFREAWGMEREHTQFREDENPEDLAASGAGLVSKYMDEAAPFIEPSAVELPVEGVIGGVNVCGIVDLLDVEGRVIDIKTAKAKPSSIDPMQKFQLATYHQLTSDANGEGRIDTLVKTKVPQLIHQLFTITEQELRATHTIYPVAQELMRSGVYVPNRRSMMCSRRNCAYWRNCEQEWGGEVPET